MLSHDQLATVRAALLFWEEEICPHPTEVGMPYYDEVVSEPLSAQAVADLRSRFHTSNVRYALCDSTCTRLASTQLFTTGNHAVQHTDEPTLVASLILPRRV